MSQNLERLKGLLAEMFQLDQAELDFGIYRIMNTKREEIVRFLDRDLLPHDRHRQVLDAFLANPKQAVPGTKMSFAGLPKPEDRVNLIAYLQSLGG